MVLARPAGVLAAIAAEALVRVDRAFSDRDATPSWVCSGTADAARSVLSTIASATMTVLGVTLSMPARTGQGQSLRTIRRVVRDRLVQAVIGSFVGTFVSPWSPCASRGWVRSPASG